VSETTERTLGKTAVVLSELGLGGAPFGDLFTRLDDAVVDETMAAAWDVGIRYFDTAPHYGAGLSEHRMGRFLRGVPRDDFVLSTKVGRVLRPAEAPEPGGRGPFVGGLPFAQVFGYGYDAVLRAYEDSLQRLGLARIDLLLIHDLDVGHHPGTGVLAAHLDDLAEGGIRALEQLRASGAIRAVGAGVNELGMIPRLLERVDLDVVLLATPYTLLGQEALDEELPLCAERGIGVVVGAVFNSGILAAPAGASAPYNYAAAPAEAVERVERLRAVCGHHDVSLAAVALRFPLAHPLVASVIPGAISPQQVRANAACFGEQIPPALWAELKAEGLLRMDAPVPQ
jgi:D-threo-aldose 1-dehydrogenase